MATEFLGLDLISLVAHDHLLLSGREALEVEALLREDLGDVRSVGLEGEGVERESMKDRRKRLAFSRGPASFS